MYICLNLNFYYSNIICSFNATQKQNNNDCCNVQSTQIYIPRKGQTEQTKTRTHNDFVFALCIEPMFARGQTAEFQFELTNERNWSIESVWFPIHNIFKSHEEHSAVKGLQSRIFLFGCYRYVGYVMRICMRFTQTILSYRSSTATTTSRSLSLFLLRNINKYSHNKTKCRKKKRIKSGHAFLDCQWYGWVAVDVLLVKDMHSYPNRTQEVSVCGFYFGFFWLCALWGNDDTPNLCSFMTQYYNLG